MPQSFRCEYGRGRYTTNLCRSIAILLAKGASIGIIGRNGF